MATQTDVQALIQSLVPSSVNNGNPNLVYNNAIPQTNGNGDWYIPSVSPAANFAGVNLSLPMWQAYGGGAYNSPFRGGFVNNGTGVTNPNWPTAVHPAQPPMGSGAGAGGGGVPNVGTVGTGGPSAPSNLNIGGQGDPSQRQTWDTYGGGTSGGISGINGIMPITNGGGTQWGSGGIGNMGNGMSPGMTRATGANAGGGFGIMQLIDMISEPILPGNYWNSQTGTVNDNALINLGSNLASQYIPGAGMALALARDFRLGTPSGAYSNRGSYLAGQSGDPTNAVDRMALNSYLDNQANARGNLQNAFDQKMAMKHNEIINRIAQNSADSIDARTEALVQAAVGGGSAGGPVVYPKTYQGSIDARNAALAQQSGTMNGVMNKEGYAGSARGASGMSSKSADNVLTGEAAQAFFAGLAASSDKAIAANLGAKNWKTAR